MAHGVARGFTRSVDGSFSRHVGYAERNRAPEHFFCRNRPGRDPYRPLCAVLQLVGCLSCLPATCKGGGGCGGCTAAERSTADAEGVTHECPASQARPSRSSLR